MSVLLKNGKILNKEGELEAADLLISNGKINTIAKPGEIQFRDESNTVDLQGKLIAPGLIDMHVHLREPGFETRETIESGTKAAARGGYTTVACMPNTNPVIDTVETVKYIEDKSEAGASSRVLIIGAITMGEKGEELVDFDALKKSGVIAFSDDGRGVQKHEVMAAGMQKAADIEMPVLAHCEDDALSDGGALHCGCFSEEHTIKGIPSESEVAHVRRDIGITRETGVHYHVCHISAAESVDLVRQAKAEGLKVTTEVTPHHLLLSDIDIPLTLIDGEEKADTNFKMNPPLRSKDDRSALVEGLLDGTIDMIATDHAPHTSTDKARDIYKAPFGVVGLETAFPLLYTKFVLENKMSLKFLLDTMTTKPAEVFGLPWGRLVEGRDADITVIDLDKEKDIDPGQFFSKGQNTPFASWKVKGWPVLTLLGGKVTWKSEDILNGKSEAFMANI